MPNLVPCSRCGAHMVSGNCPTCGDIVPVFGPSLAAVLLGLALAGCPKGEDGPPIAALYGGPVQEEAAPTPAPEPEAVMPVPGPVQALYGVPVMDMDRDHDGFKPFGQDCDDENAAVHPGAPDVVGDGIDSDCDGLDTPKPPGT